MGKPSAPKPPDPNKTASAQTAANIGTAIANQYLGQTNQVTPYGNLSYNQTGTYQWTDPLSGKEYDIPQFTAQTDYTPAGQQIVDNTQRLQTNLSQLGADQVARLGGLLDRPMDVSTLPARGDLAAVRAANLRGAPGSPDLSGIPGQAGDITRTYGIDWSQDRQRVEDALMTRLNPQLARDRSALEQRLADQGIAIGSEAYTRAMSDFGQQSNDARIAAILAGGQEQSRLAGLEAQRANFQNSAQGQVFNQLTGLAQLEGDNAYREAGFDNQTALGQQNADAFLYDAQNAQRAAALQEEIALRNQPFNELGAVLGGSQVQSPEFVNTPITQAPTVDYAGLVNQNYAQQQANYQQKMESWNSMVGGLMGLGGQLGGAWIASDRRLKTDIRRVGTAANGLPLYLFRYRSGGPMQVGLMAQDVIKVRPDAVRVGSDGMMAVNYDAALED